MPEQRNTDPTSAPIIPQIKSTLVNAMVLFIVTPMLVFSGMYWLGELKGWADLRKALEHVLFADVFLTFGWIAMKSPISPRFLALFKSVRTLPGGMQQEVEVMLDQPAVDSGQTRTTKIDPTTQSVTITEKPSALAAGPDPPSK